MGCIQATEVVKLAMDYGETLEGRLVAYDAARCLSRRSLSRQPDCPVCGDDPAIASVADAATRAAVARRGLTGTAPSSVNARLILSTEVYRTDSPE